jgi:hypothetical protein
MPFCEENGWLMQNGGSNENRRHARTDPPSDAKRRLSIPWNSVSPLEIRLTLVRGRDRNGDHGDRQWLQEGIADKRSIEYIIFHYNVTSGHCPTGTTEKVDCWPNPEVPNDIDMTVGMFGLTDTEENQIVAVLQTLTDGFATPYPDGNTFTGAYMTCNPATDPNCSPSRQGNNFLIPTPSPLPPCATAVCGVAPLPGPNPIP